MAVAAMKTTRGDNNGDKRGSVEQNVNFILDKESCNLVQDGCRGHHHDGLY
jgi:hypothetical protein